MRNTLCALLGIFVTACATMPAGAQTIGRAATVRNEVNEVRGSQNLPINVGQDVYSNEVVRTSVDSSTKLVLRDDTNLAVGPTSTIKLDRFVFAGENNAKDVTVNMTRGAFRFVTGVSEKKAYQINTPTATMSVRGTTLDILADDVRTVVDLVEGEATICTRTAPKRCRVVSTPGAGVVVTPNGIAPVSPGAPGSFNFAASFCGGDPALCAPTQLAGLDQFSSPSTQPGAPPLAVAAVVGAVGAVAVITTNLKTNLPDLPPLSCVSACGR